jgi:parvulin-like peptidyl-prolyl isomerase
MKTRRILTVVVPLLLLAGCSREPAHIQVQHILISFEGAIDKESVTRTMEEAEALAQEVYDLALGGSDFAALVQEYTDDQYPGIYAMANLDVQPDQGEYARSRMVQVFGDVGFGLKVDEIGMGGYDPETSPYGWHIIKRLR